MEEGNGETLNVNILYFLVQLEVIECGGGRFLKRIGNVRDYFFGKIIKELIRER